PVEHDLNLRDGLVRGFLSPGKQESLAVRSAIPISEGNRTVVPFSSRIKQQPGRFSVEGTQACDPDRKNVRWRRRLLIKDGGRIEDFAPGCCPYGLEASRGRNWNLCPRSGVRLYIDFRSSGFERRIRNPPAVRRKLGVGQIELRFDEKFW